MARPLLLAAGLAALAIISAGWQAQGVGWQALLLARALAVPACAAPAPAPVGLTIRPPACLPARLLGLGNLAPPPPQLFSVIPKLHTPRPSSIPPPSASPLGPPAAAAAGTAGLDASSAQAVFGDLPACQGADWELFASKGPSCGTWTTEPGSTCPEDCSAAHRALGEACLAAVSLESFKLLGFNASAQAVAAVV